MELNLQVAKYYKLLHDLSTNNDTGQTRSAGTRNQTRTSGGNQRVFGSSRTAAGVGGYEVPDADQANSSNLNISKTKILRRLQIDLHFRSNVEII